MTKTWANYPCTFSTGNTENTNGNSQYTITAERMTRYAPINAKRAPEQVMTGNPSICYLTAGGLLNKAIMETDANDDHLITVVAVVGDVITVKVDRGPMEPVIGDCARIPKNGLVTFDFANADGVLSYVHVGHAVILLKV